MILKLTLCTIIYLIIAIDHGQCVKVLLTVKQTAHNPISFDVECAYDYDADEVIRQINVTHNQSPLHCR